MRKERTRGYVALVGAVLIMGVLFYSSSMPYAQQSAIPFLTTHLAHEPFRDWLLPISFHYAGVEISIAQLGYAAFVEFLLRKAAHFLSFFALGWCWAVGLRPQLRQRWVAIGLSVLLVIGYAVFDEFHQSLTIQRSALFQDVVLDSVGGLLAICLYHTVFYRKQRRLRRMRKGATHRG